MHAFKLFKNRKKTSQFLRAYVKRVETDRRRMGLYSQQNPPTQALKGGNRDHFIVAIF